MISIWYLPIVFLFVSFCDLFTGLAISLGNAGKCFDCLFRWEYSFMTWSFLIIDIIISSFTGARGTGVGKYSSFLDFSFFLCCKLNFSLAGRGWGTVLAGGKVSLNFFCARLLYWWIIFFLLSCRKFITVTNQRTHRSRRTPLPVRHCSRRGSRRGSRTIRNMRLYQQNRISCVFWILLGSIMGYAQSHVQVVAIGGWYPCRLRDYCLCPFCK